MVQVGIGGAALAAGRGTSCERLRRRWWGMNESKPACRAFSLAVGAAYVLALVLPARADTLPGALA